MNAHEAEQFLKRMAISLAIVAAVLLLILWVIS
jgi:hypothetical protein